jgi:hypothetical protein
MNDELCLEHSSLSSVGLGLVLVLATGLEGQGQGQVAELCVAKLCGQAVCQALWLIIRDFPNAASRLQISSQHLKTLLIE